MKKKGITPCVNWAERLSRRRASNIHYESTGLGHSRSGDLCKVYHGDITNASSLLMPAQALRVGGSRVSYGL